MKHLDTFNLFHTSLAKDLDRIIEGARDGSIKEDDIQFVRFEDETRPYGVQTPVSERVAGYEENQYREAVEDYLRLMVLCGFRRNGDLFHTVKAEHEDEDGNLTVDAYYTNDPNEEGVTIATVLADTTVEDRQGNPIGTIFQFGEKANNVIADAVIRQENRREALIEAVHDDIVKQVQEGDTTVMAELLKFVPHENLLQSLKEDHWRNHLCKSTV
jgi:hypothetical protein